MSRLALAGRNGVLAALAAGAVVVACSVPYDHDVAAVSQRYAHKYNGPCSSWLHSAKTGFSYCASPPIPKGPPVIELVAVPAAAPKPKAERKTDLASMQQAGSEIYGSLCVTCHGPEGKGVPGAFPPLAGSGGFYGDPQNMARIIVHGLTGEIVVQGQTFNGQMPAQGGTFDDYEIAAVATYVRTSFGNADGPVTPEDVAAVR